MFLAILAMLSAATVLVARAGRLGRLLPFLVAVDSLLLGLFCLEIYFAWFHDQSDGFNLTQAGRAWFERHWKPVNALGYRDGEVAPKTDGDTVVVLLGDSFTAGHGIPEVSQRFGDIAASRLGPGVKLYNVAKLGWDTRDELRALDAFPVAPDLVVLVYVVNDILGAAVSRGFSVDFPIRLPRKGLLDFLVKHSALADFVYWRLSRFGNLSGGARSYWDCLREAYQNPDVWAEHERELAALSALCRERGAKLAVLVFPMPHDVRGSAPITAKVARTFQEMGRPVVDLSPLFRDWSVSDLVVNANDAHPSQAVNRAVAVALERLIVSEVSP